MRLPRPILGSTSAWPAAARFPQGHDMRFASLRSRLIALSLFIVVGAMVTLATTLILADRAALLETHTQDSRELAASEASKIAEWFESRAHAVKSALLATDKDDPVEILRVVQVAGDFEMSLLGYADKRMYSYPAGRRAADFDPTIRSWYTETLKAGGPIISQPRTGASSGALMVTLTQPVRRNGQIIGVVGGNAAIQVGGRVKVNKRGRRRGVGVVIRGNEYGLDGSNGTVHSRGDALLKRAHLGREIGLIAHGGRHAAQQR